MIDARNIYRKVTRKIYDFSPEQEQNLLAMVWLYRGETGRYLRLVGDYCRRMLGEGAACFATTKTGAVHEPLLPGFVRAMDSLRGAVEPFLKTLGTDLPHMETPKELDDAMGLFKAEMEMFSPVRCGTTGGVERAEENQRGAEKGGGSPCTPCRNQPQPGQADGSAL